MQNASVFENFTVRIHDANDQLVELTMFQLLQWIHALRAEIRHGMKLAQGGGRKTSTVIKGFLSCRKDYPVEDLLDHLEQSKENIMGQLSLKVSHEDRMRMRKQEAAMLSQEITALSAEGAQIPHEHTVRLFELTSIIADDEEAMAHG